MTTNYPSINDEVPPSSVIWGLESNNFVFTSFSNVTQAISQIGDRWRGRMQFDPTEQEALNLQLFVEQLHGRAGRFKVRHPGVKTYPEQGTPTVNAPNQTGTLLTTQGWKPNVLVIRKGQYFNINHELKRATRDVFSDNVGLASINFYPAIRIMPAVSTPINTSNPYMLASLNRNYNPFETDENFQTKVTLEFTEAVYERA